MRIEKKIKENIYGFCVNYPDNYGYQLVINIEEPASPIHILAYNAHDISCWRRVTYGINTETYLRRNWSNRHQCSQDDYVLMRGYFRGMYKTEFNKLSKMKYNKAFIKTLVR